MKENESINNRYHRQLILPDFGMQDQVRLLNARVLVVGAGGLGCPVLMVLAGAGIGNIGIVDDGLVELTNLHRQFLYGVDDIGKLKVECAERRLQGMNPDIKIDLYPERLYSRNAWNILSEYDIIIDGTDNFATRYMINDACVLMDKILVYGAVSRYEGQVAIFNKSISYRDVFPVPPAVGEVAGCNEAGVLGVLPGLIGHFMANECIKLIRQTGTALIGKLMTFSSADNRAFIMDVFPTVEGRMAIPENREEFEKNDYPAQCGVADNDYKIDSLGIQRLENHEEVVLIDVRELHELPEIKSVKHIRIPLSVLSERIAEIPDKTLVFICQSGVRSVQAVDIYKRAAGRDSAKIYSFKGGVNKLDQQ